MILNGKTKEDFIDYIDSDDLLVEGMSDVHRNALIIEFFDSVGIYINIRNLELQRWFFYEVNYLDKFESTSLYGTRQEATIQAITKANEIYNERFK